jgi:hypothetical protein
VIVDVVSASLAVDDAVAAEEGQVLRDSGLVECGYIGQVTHAALAVREVGEDDEPRLVTERSEQPGLVSQATALLLHGIIPRGGSGLQLRLFRHLARS